MKLVSISFDDGTIYDKRFIELLNKYHLRATFNLNSGLDNYVWYYEDKIAIKRPCLAEVKDIYKGHEVASHTSTHPKLTEESDEEIIRQVNSDIDKLSEIFSCEVPSFAVPFDLCNEHIIEVVRNNTKAKNIRTPYYMPNTFLPKDPYHLGITAMYDDKDIYERLETFIKNDDPVSYFIIAGHTYEFEVKDDWGKIEDLLKYLSSHDEFEVVTVKEAVKRIFG